MKYVITAMTKKYRKIKLLKGIILNYRNRTNKIIVFKSTVIYKY